MEWLNMHILINIVELDSTILLKLVVLWCAMGDSDESRRTSSGMENLSIQTNRCPRDLLQRFMGSSISSRHEEREEEREGEIELNLGLSLGGRFGVDKSANKLMRSSSIAGSIPIVRDDDVLTPSTPVAAAYPRQSLVRTSSLPVETEEEWRKRKELQTLRRMEAKRRRSEKQRGLKGDKDFGGSGGAGGGGGGCLGFGDERKEIEVNSRGRIQRDQYIVAMNKVGSSVAPPFGLPSWAAAARQTILGGGIEALIGKGKGNYAAGGGGTGSGSMQGLVQPSSQGSMESQGGSSSSMSELDSKPLQGSSSGGEASPASIQSVEERRDQDAMGSSGAMLRENARRSSGAEIESPKRSDVAGNRGKEIGSNSLEDMPCVFTKGDGTNGRRIEGILYKYGKGEEVRIMCVCHGMFHSPAGFVKHAGGTDVAYPLKHIVVNPNSASFS